MLFSFTDRSLLNAEIRNAIIFAFAALLFPYSLRTGNGEGEVLPLQYKTGCVGHASLCPGLRSDSPTQRCFLSGGGLPYVKSRAFFTCPLDRKGTISYTFNSGLAGISLKDVAWTDKTVLIYEGKADKLDYHHDDRAAIGFVDGHCKLIRPGEATALFWTVQDSKTK